MTFPTSRDPCRVLLGVRATVAHRKCGAAAPPPSGPRTLSSGSCSAGTAMWKSKWPRSSAWCTSHARRRFARAPPAAVIAATPASDPVQHLPCACCRASLLEGFNLHGAERRASHERACHSGSRCIHVHCVRCSLL